MMTAADRHGVELAPSGLHTIGEIQAANGEYAEAEQTTLACIARHDAGHINHADDLAYYRLTLARARRGLGDLVQAQQHLDACRELCAELDLHELLAQVHGEQAELHAACGDHHAAFTQLKAFIAARDNLSSREREAQAQARQAMFETTEARQQAEQFREQARRDPLTGLHNRRYADEELPALITSDPGLTLAIADIDHFKRINDTLSHDAGDQVLIQVAKILDTELAAEVPHGFTARLGGEEFLLVLPATALAAATAVLNRIRHAVSAYDWHDTAERPARHHQHRRRRHQRNHALRPDRHPRQRRPQPLRRQTPGTQPRRHRHPPATNSPPRLPRPRHHLNTQPSMITRHTALG
nr:hypothetical protein GCM10020092_028770 [Actinoplanes digitatis]